MVDPLCGNCAEVPPLAGRTLCAACGSWMDEMLDWFNQEAPATRRGWHMSRQRAMEVHVEVETVTADRMVEIDARCMACGVELVRAEILPGTSVMVPGHDCLPLSQVPATTPAGRSAQAWWHEVLRNMRGDA
jgi:hypothetical protein